MTFKLGENPYSTERLELSDGDFLDLDWIRGGYDQLMVLSHGLEGNSRSHYVVNAARHFAAHGWDVLAWNFRSCSREMNRKPKLYHIGETADFDAVLQHVIQTRKYRSIVLVGFSTGGNMTLKYLGERVVSESIKAAVVFSVPCDAWGSARKLGTFRNRVFERKFTDKLRRKMLRKSHQFPEVFNDLRIEQLKSLEDFTDQVLIPMYGFRDAAHYYSEVAGLNYLPSIRIPTLMVNALNDPMLGKGSFPKVPAQDSACFYVEYPASGGHCGFIQKGEPGSWMELRTLDFLAAHLEV